MKIEESHNLKQPLQYKLSLSLVVFYSVLFIVSLRLVPTVEYPIKFKL